MNIKKYTFSVTLFFYLIISAHTSFSAVIIFDLNGVLLANSNLSASWHIGMTKFIGWYNPFTVQDKIMEFLDLIDPRTPQTPKACYQDKLLPKIWCDYLMGLKSSLDIRAEIAAGLVRHKSFFKNKRERKLASAIMDFLFDPETLAKTIKPLKKGMKLFKKCRTEVDSEGNPAHRIFILSNWDRESFEFLLSNPKIKKLIDACDGVVISSLVHMIKPEREIYEYLFEEYKIDPETELTIFLDDQKENIQAAEDLKKKNLVCLHCKNSHFKAAKKELRRLEIID